MSNKIYKSKMKDEYRLLGKFVNISLIALSIIFVLLFLKIIVTEISFHKMIAEMVEGIDYYIEDIVITDKETVEDYNGSESGATNYFFHYGHDTNKRMQVLLLYLCHRFQQHTHGYLCRFPEPVRL